jgi:hypothetical protein
MSAKRDITYSFDLGRQRNALSSPSQRSDGDVAVGSIPRITRLMALALRFDGLLRKKTIRDYAELASLGRVTRARITQIMKLLNLAPDIQERILFLPDTSGLNERNLRPIACKIDWGEQRRMFQKIIGGGNTENGATD